MLELGINALVQLVGYVGRQVGRVVGIQGQVVYCWVNVWEVWQLVVWFFEVYLELRMQLFILLRGRGSFQFGGIGDLGGDYSQIFVIGG